jgi:hypothetical protein
MRVIQIEQNSDEWVQHRIGRITGTKVKGIRPLSRDKTKRYNGFWKVVAEKAAIAADGEPDSERGHRLESVALDMMGKRIGLPFDADPGVWVSDIDDDIMVSPDGAQPTSKTEKPTYAAEIKALKSAYHLKYLYEDYKARQEPTYNPFDGIPHDAHHNYQDQVLQYFVVNEALQDLYFGLFDDRQELDNLVLWIIHIKRSDVERLIEENLEMELGALVEINSMLAELAGIEN